jgi:signal recognition particle subunit SRP54
VIFDTAGVQDTVPLVESSLPDLVRYASPEWKVLVCDAAGGQQVSALAEYLSPLGLDGCVLTKTDGDALGGAALTMVSVSGRPILFVGTGEGVGDLEVFSPEGMASRIMGQGDLATLASRAKEVAPSVKLEGKFDFNSMLGMFSAVRAMGGISWVAKMMPGTVGRKADSAASGLARIEAIVLSMSAEERSNPGLLSESSRIFRIAHGSGQAEGTVRELVNRLESFRLILPSLRR